MFYGSSYCKLPRTCFDGHYFSLTTHRNSAGLGIYVLMSALFAGILLSPPFLWGFNTLGYVFVGQIATAIAAPFVCGYLSDQTIKWLSKRNKGVSEVKWSPLHAYGHSRIDGK